MEKSFWIIGVFVAGALLPIQAGLNGKMGRSLNSPEWAVLISFLVGTVAMIGYVLVTRNTFQMHKLTQVPGESWIAGVLGAIYVTMVVLAFPKLGAAFTFGLIVAGQLAISLALDHFGVLVPRVQPVTIYRLIGLVLIVIGVVMVRKG